MSERKGTRGLELWCKKLVKDCPNVKIDNMTTSWRNGIGFCAMVHHFRPDLIDLSTLRPENIYDNNKLAFSIAEKELGIPALLDPEDMVENDVPDRLSVLTYLSQFYRLLGHKVKKSTENQELKNETHVKTSPAIEPSSNTTIQFGKIGLDKCAACDLPVYLAQRLFVSQKLYHRRCFRCHKCSGQLNPKNFDLVEGSQLSCENCKNESSIISKLLNNNDQMGMLAYNDDISKKTGAIDVSKSFTSKPISRPQSVLEKISLFEKNNTKDTNIDTEDKIKNNSLTDSSSNKLKYTDTINITKDFQSNDEFDKTNRKINQDDKLDFNMSSNEHFEIANFYNKKPEKVYKSNTNQFNFLQTQLSNIVLDTDSALVEAQEPKQDCIIDDKESEDKKDIIENDISMNIIDESNITDDSRIAISLTSNLDSSVVTNESTINMDKDVIAVPPRRKKHLNLKKNKDPSKEVDSKHNNTSKYPENLNPFSDDEDEIPPKETPKKISTNPFGSSDEEEDSVPPINTSIKAPAVPSNTQRRLISANPFWSDGEDPSSDEEIHNNSSSMHKSSVTTSTPNLPGSGRRKKGRAPAPPAPLAPPPAPLAPPPALHVDDADIGSVSSLTSFNSTKSYGKSSPVLKRLAPTPSDTLSTMSAGDGSIEKGMDTSENRKNSSTENVIRRVKGPAPGLPLPERREVKLQMSPEELQVQLDMLETQQLGLERQGVLIEQMIRQKCEGDEACSAPQEEVEDLVIQLCEIVNEKNDLFRKQTELMYIRRQQRLEQEQADIEHEIRIIQSRPAVNRIDADKAREEQLVSRLVRVVRLRDELVQQLDAERRRERQEDLAIAHSIATKRAQRHSDSTSSSMQSEEALTIPKKNKMKDKVKKQLKKAKHTLIPKKKDESEKLDKVEKKK